MTGSSLSQELRDDACLVGTGPAGDLRSSADQRKRMAGSGLSQEPMDDACLVGAVLAGNHDVFGDLYDRYVHLLQAVCYDMTGNFHETDDLVHDVFLRAFRRLEQLRRPDRFGPWLLIMARRTCRDWQRRRIRDRRRQSEVGGVVRDHVNPPSSNDSLVALQRAIAQLPEKERLAIHLFYLEGQHVMNARKMLGMSRSGFYRVLERARKRLRRTTVRHLEI